MSSINARSIETHDDASPLFSRRGWLWLVILGSLFVFFGRHYLLRMYRIATGEWGGDWSHALIIPLISVYFIYQHRQELAVSLRQDRWPALTWLLRLAGPVMIVAAVLLKVTPAAVLGGFGTLLQGVSGIILIVGLLLLTIGPDAVRLVWSPLCRKLTGLEITANHGQRLIGLLTLIMGLVSYGWWIGPGRNDMLQGYSLILALLGLTLLVLGPAPMRLLWFPILYLALGVKVADRWWNALAGQMQDLAAKGATVVLSLVGALMDIEASVRGTTIEVWHRGKLVEPPLTVAEACAGLRMLMAFIALGVAMAYLAKRPWWQRLIMVLLSVPIAVAVNIGRVSVMGLLSPFYPEFVHGDFHIFIGMVMLIPAAGLFWLVGWILDNLVSYEDASYVTPEEAAIQATGPLQPTLAFPPADVSPFPVTWSLRGIFSGALIVGLTASAIGLGMAMVTPQVFNIQTNVTASGIVQTNNLTWLAPVVNNPALAWSLLTVMLLGLLALLAWTGRLSLAALRSRWVTQLLTASFAAGVLIASTAAVEGGVSLLNIVRMKEPVPLRAPLVGLTQQTNSWIMDVPDRQPPRLPPEQEEALGTRNYVIRNYMPLHPETSVAKALTLQVAYYTGTPDTVPHVPDRCFLGGGLEPVGSAGQTMLHLAGPTYSQEGNQWLVHRSRKPTPVRLPETDIQATIFTFTNPKQATLAHNVIYFFAANGTFWATPDLVRLHGFGLRDRYSYYCKIEVLVHGIGDREEATQVASGFLSEMMPEIMAALPDWRDVTEGKWPVAKTPSPTTDK